MSGFKLSLGDTVCNSYIVISNIPEWILLINMEGWDFRDWFIETGVMYGLKRSTWRDKLIMLIMLP